MTRQFLPIIIFLLLLGLTFACKQSGIISEEVGTDGEKLFKRSCQSCHVLPKPGLKSDENWPIFVRRYGTRAKLSEGEIASITEYLIANN